MRLFKKTSVFWLPTWLPAGRLWTIIFFSLSIFLPIITNQNPNPPAMTGEIAAIRPTKYYPFGMVMTQSNPGTSPENKLLYNSKEIQDDVVAGKKLDWYDYGARFYDAQLGRFHTQDRFAEKYLSWTPYQYGGNNPISFIDINGDSIWHVNPKGFITYEGDESNWNASTHTLYAISAEGKRVSIGVNDRSILEQLSTDRNNKAGRPGYANFFKDGVSYAVTTNKEEAFNVFFFVTITAGTQVEWALDGYVTNGKNEYILATGHTDKYAPTTFGDRLPERDLYNLNFSIHSHAAHNSRGGGSWSGDWDIYDWRSNALNGRRAELGKHYVLEVKERRLYNFKGTNERHNQYIRTINSPSDLYRRLGF
jgi:RHS repeat-associated protein